MIGASVGRVNTALGHAYPDEAELTDRRVGPRHISVLRVGRAVWNGRDQLCVVRNLSSGGLLFECLHPPAIDEHVGVELRSDRQMSGIVRWVRDGHAGIQFDQPIDVEQILKEERNSLLRVRPRAPRFVRRGTVRLIGRGDPFNADIVDTPHLHFRAL